jgi:hypothetical protein
MRQFDFDSPLLRSAARGADSVATRRSEPAIISFAAFSLLGALAISYYCLAGLGQAGGAVPVAADTPVYNGKAVPRDDAQAQTSRPLGGTLTTTVAHVSATEGSDLAVGENGEGTHRLAGGERSARRELPSIRERDLLYSFPEFDAMQHAVSLGAASALAGSVGSRSGSGEIQAPGGDFVSVAPVPESSSWSFAGAITLFLCAGERLRKRRLAARAVHR